MSRIFVISCMVKWIGGYVQKHTVIFQPPLALDVDISLKPSTAQDPVNCGMLCSDCQPHCLNIKRKGNFPGQNLQQNLHPPS